MGFSIINQPFWGTSIGNPHAIQRFIGSNIVQGQSVKYESRKVGNPTMGLTTTKLRCEWKQIGNAKLIWINYQLYVCNMYELSSFVFICPQACQEGVWISSELFH